MSTQVTVTSTGVQVDVAGALPVSAAQLAALNAASAPSAENPVATMNDVAPLDAFRLVAQTNRSDMAVYHPLAEVAGTTAIDYSGHGRHSPLTGNYALGADGAGDGRTAVQLTAGAVNLYGALLAGFNPAAGTLSIDVQIPAGVWADSTDRYIIDILTDANSQIRVRRYGSSANGLYIEYVVAGVAKAIPVISRYETRFLRITFTWDTAADQLIGYVNGSQVAVPTTGISGWAGDLYANLCCAGAARSDTWSSPFTGKIKEIALYDTALPGATIAALYDAHRPVTGVMVLGDSKSGPSYPWYRLAMDQLATDGHGYEERPMRYYAAGWKVSDLKASITANLAAEWAVAQLAWINIGANDLSAATSESSFKADLAAIIDALRAKYAGILVYIALPWRRGYDAAGLLMAGWIRAVIATYASGVYEGPNENAWLKSTDDGAALTIDGAHYNVAGIQAACAQWASL